MVAAVGIRATQAGALTATAGNNLRLTQSYALVAMTYPAEAVRNTQTGVIVAFNSANELRLSEAKVLVAVAGKSDNTKIRAWTYTMDGHDFYILRLGESATLVYDTYSDQWSTWDSDETTYWRAAVGINWVGGTVWAAPRGSNVLVGDDTFGTLYLLDPTLGYDEDPEVGADEIHKFTRAVIGQVPVQGRSTIPCFNVYLTASFGTPCFTTDGVTLYTSDDIGNTYNNQGTIPITIGDYRQDLYWSSLGQMRAPGRLFKIEDDGALIRIDALELNSGNE